MSKKGPRKVDTADRKGYFRVFKDNTQAGEGEAKTKELNPYEKKTDEKLRAAYVVGKDSLDFSYNGHLFSANFVDMTWKRRERNHNAKGTLQLHEDYKYLEDDRNTILKAVQAAGKDPSSPASAGAAEGGNSKASSATPPGLLTPTNPPGHFDHTAKSTADGGYASDPGGYAMLDPEMQKRLQNDPDFAQEFQRQFELEMAKQTAMQHQVAQQVEQQNLLVYSMVLSQMNLQQNQQNSRFAPNQRKSANPKQNAKKKSAAKPQTPKEGKKSSDAAEPMKVAVPTDLEASADQPAQAD